MKTSRAGWLDLFALALGSLLLTAGTAHAYCRTYTKDDRESRCPQPCMREGVPISWSRPDIKYTFNVRGFDGLDDTELRQIVAKSFAAWEEVECADGELIELELDADDETSEREVGTSGDEPIQNMIVYHDADAWSELGHDRHSFALTTISFSTSGELLGADIAFNGGLGPFGDCEKHRASGQVRTDLQNVATHEIGHFLGLAHSDVASSTMTCRADPTDLDKRTLSSDDRAALCAAYPPNDTFVMPQEGCSECAVGRRAAERSYAALWGLALSAWFVVRRVRRRRRD